MRSHPESPAPQFLFVGLQRSVGFGQTYLDGKRNGLRGFEGKKQIGGGLVNLYDTS